MLVPSDIIGSCSEATMRRGARDRRGLRSEEHRHEQGHRAKRCGSTQILSPGTSIAKEHVGTGMGETGGTRLADAMIKAQRWTPVRDGEMGCGECTPLTSTTLESNMSVKPNHRLQIGALSVVLGLVSLTVPQAAHAGVYVSMGFPWPVPVIPPPVVVAPPPVIAYPAPVVVAPGYYGYYGSRRGYWRLHPYQRW